MSLRGLRWVAIVLPIAFMAALELWSLSFLEPALGEGTGHLVSLIVVSGGIVAFSAAIFGVLERMQARIEARNRELAALDAMGRALGSSLDLDRSLSIAMDGVAEMTGADAVGVALADERGRLDLKQARGRHRELLEPMMSAGSSAVSYSPGAALVEGTAGAVRIAVPLQAGDQLLGMLLVASEGELNMTQQEAERLLGAVASQVAAAIERNRLIVGLQHREREAQALYRIGLQISSLQDLSKILQTVVEQARELLRAEVAGVCMIREPGGEVALAEWAGPPGAIALGSDSRPLPATGLLRRLGEAQATCAILAVPFRQARLAVPLIVGARVVGELCVADRGQREFTEGERTLLAGLADMAAIAINNANLLERERGVAVLEERDRLAKEMHDSLAQILGYIHLKSKATARTIEQGEARRGVEELQEIADLAHEAYVDVREAILGLRESVSPSRGLVGTLAEYVGKFSRQSGIAARFEPLESLPRLTPGAEVQLVRVIQEALTNVRKHSGARSVNVRMESVDHLLRISIEDDGRGFDVQRLQGGDGRQFGIQTIRERVERVGGRFQLESVPGAGTRVTIDLPLFEEGGRDGSNQTPAGG